jgi:hypothetical protein
MPNLFEQEETERTERDFRVVLCLLLFNEMDSKDLNNLFARWCQPYYKVS